MTMMTRSMGGRVRVRAAERPKNGRPTGGRFDAAILAHAGEAWGPGSLAKIVGCDPATVRYAARRLEAERRWPGYGAPRPKGVSPGVPVATRTAPTKGEAFSPRVIAARCLAVLEDNGRRGADPWRKRVQELWSLNMIAAWQEVCAGVPLDPEASNILRECIADNWLVLTSARKHGNTRDDALAEFRAMIDEDTGKALAAAKSDLDALRIERLAACMRRAFDMMLDQVFPPGGGAAA